jgi:membrane associated rhomboid family serine protease
METPAHHHRPPWVTYLLAAANLVVFVAPPAVTLTVFRNDGWLSLLGTVVAVLLFGSNVEDRFGRVRFLLFYLLCGYLAAYCTAQLSDTSTGALAGAPAAASGVAGAYLALLPRARAGSMARVLAFLPERLPAWPVLILWFVFQWFAGHAAPAVLGFVIGVFATLPMLRRRRPRDAYPARRSWRRASQA